MEKLIQEPARNIVVPDEVNVWVVGGGIAYRLGFVAVSILMVMGIASLFVGQLRRREMVGDRCSHTC